MSNQPRYVRVKRFAELTGYSTNAVYNKMYDGTWIEGIHYIRAPDNNPLINLDAYERWAEGEQLTKAVNLALSQMGKPETKRRGKK